MKKLPIYGAKTMELKVADMDAGSRTVKGYLSAFGIIDSDNDMIMPGAFKKSITENGPLSSSNRKIAFLRNHEWEDQIGKMLELSEDDYGLLFVAQLGRSSKGDDALLDYQDGIIREHSIGFSYVPDKMKAIETADGMYWAISEVKLWEGSAVTFGSNQFTPVLQVAKGMDSGAAKQAALEKLAQETEAIAKAIRNGKGTDSRLQELEMRVKTLAQRYQALAETDGPHQKAPATVPVEPQPQPFAAQKFFYNFFAK
jgi:HK97 family phage prohead protease